MKFTINHTAAYSDIEVDYKGFGVHVKVRGNAIDMTRSEFVELAERVLAEIGDDLTDPYHPNGGVHVPPEMRLSDPVPLRDYERAIRSRIDLPKQFTDSVSQS